jgi:phosphoadenosine phosphosulfate reductase
MITKSDLQKVAAEFVEHASIGTQLSCLAKLYPDTVRFSTSFSKEDQAITFAISQFAPSIQIFTLDTGRLFEETYSTWSATQERLGVSIIPYTPDTQKLQEFLAKKGPNAFFESVENRLECCAIRKVEPLRRALQGADIWITGLRRSHSPDRKNLPQIEWDESHSLIKVHPILDWSDSELDTYIAEHNIPINRLHAKGFPSIGCAPCTRAVKAGEDFRAGRWWWENSEKKECGLHVHKRNT